MFVRWFIFYDSPAKKTSKSKRRNLQRVKKEEIKWLPKVGMHGKYSNYSDNDFSLHNRNYGRKNKYFWSFPYFQNELKNLNEPEKGNKFLLWIVLGAPTKQLVLFCYIFCYIKGFYITSLLPWYRIDAKFIKKEFPYLAMALEAAFLFQWTYWPLLEGI